tara:strand:+ start:199 stop:342 length:144 start_codon:yes stop_codon:yes gene_type:complete
VKFPLLLFTFHIINIGKPATPEFIKGATLTFGEWWLRSLEHVKKLGN